MALNLQTFRTRTISAIIFAGVMLVGLLFNLWCFLTLFAVIHFGCWIEFVKLMKKINSKNYLSYSLLGLIYITVPILVMIKLGVGEHNSINGTNHEWYYEPLGPCAIIFSLWINDTMAYVVGSMIGKTPLTKISPKKTWEGTVGGAILCVVIIALLGYFIPYAQIIALKHWIAIASICAVFGTLGDLLESKLKRMADVKDSGSIMPGHGGFLDRFDSMLVATPFVFLYIIFAGST